MLHKIFGTEDQARIADIVFVHGINPLGTLRQTHAFETWGGEDKDSDFWPKWLGEDLRGDGLPIAVWVLEYDAAALGWLGSAMPLTDRATSVLDTFYGERIGQRPIIFISHSLGGLVVKQMLHRSATVELDTERAISENTRAVIFMATPHTGADIASFASKLGPLLRQTEALKEMAANAAPLRDQANWYLHQSPKLGIRTRAYIETRTDHGILVVDQTSADPKVAGSSVVPVDANHSAIAKMASRDLPQYKSIRRFIEDSLRINPT